MESKYLEILTHDRMRLVAFVLIVTALFLVQMPLQLRADGKLRRVSEAVRKKQPPSIPRPPSSNPEGKQSDSMDDHSNQHNHNSSHHDPQTEFTYGNSHHEDTHMHVDLSLQPSECIYVSPLPRCASPVFLPVVSHPPSVIFDQPYLVEAPRPAYELSVIEEFESIVPEPVLISVEPPVDQDLVFNAAALCSDWFQTETSRIWAMVGSDFDGITIGGLGLHLQQLGGLGLESSVMTLRESAPTYRDHLWIGDVNLVYEVLSRGDLRGRMGLGVNWLSDAWGGEAGFNLTAGIDLRLTERILFSAEGDLGSLGDADYFHGRFNLARRFERSELIMGVEHFNIGGAEITNFFTGIQFRF